MSIQFNSRPAAEDGVPQPGSKVTLPRLSQQHTLPLGPLTLFPFCLPDRTSRLRTRRASAQHLQPGHRAAPNFPDHPGRDSPAAPPPGWFRGETARPPPRRRPARPRPGGGLSPLHHRPACRPAASPQPPGPVRSHSGSAAAPGTDQPRSSAPRSTRTPALPSALAFGALTCRRCRGAAAPSEPPPGEPPGLSDPRCDGAADAQVCKVSRLRPRPDSPRPPAAPPEPPRAAPGSPPAPRGTHRFLTGALPGPSRRLRARHPAPPFAQRPLLSRSPPFRSRYGALWNARSAGARARRQPRPSLGS